MRKRITNLRDEPVAESEWLDLTELADVEVTSEDPSTPLERVFARDAPAAWRAAEPGRQTIRLRFLQPIRIQRIRLTFDERDQARTQEFVLRWRAQGADHDAEVVRQQFTFAPPDTVREREEYRVSLDRAVALELSIVPDISGGTARATLGEFSLA